MSNFKGGVSATCNHVVKFKAVFSETLSSKYDPRYVLINEETGEIIDDAQGYGYKSKENAYAAGHYKFRDRTKDAEKAAKEKAIKKWLSEHKHFGDDMEDCSFQAAKYGEKFTARNVAAMLKEGGYTGLPFTAGELLKYWTKGPKYSKKKKSRR